MLTKKNSRNFTVINLFIISFGDSLELFNGEDAAKNKIDANLIVKASAKFRRLYVKEFISVQVNKKIVTWHDVPIHDVSAENVNTKPENAIVKWNEVILILLKMPKRCLRGCKISYSMHL